MALRRDVAAITELAVLSTTLSVRVRTALRCSNAGFLEMREGGVGRPRFGIGHSGNTQVLAHDAVRLG